MFVSYAITFICTVFPCMTIVHVPESSSQSGGGGGGGASVSSTSSFSWDRRGVIFYPNPMHGGGGITPLAPALALPHALYPNVSQGIYQIHADHHPHPQKPGPDHHDIEEEYPNEESNVHIYPENRPETENHNKHKNSQTQNQQNELHAGEGEVEVEGHDYDYHGENPIVRIRDGSLRGFFMRTLGNRSIAAFKGIPFARPPVGDLRFKAPIRNIGWVGIRDAIADTPTCIQTDYIQQYKVHGQEDCLYLNVYAPQKVSGSGERESRQGLPVMVFIHGGGWFFSSSSLYGPAYLLDQDVLLVTINYRLGIFGFLSTGDEASPGNNGLKDQTLALKWVKENIALFGGDPSRVTIFGESAGAGSVHFHMVSKLSKGLFQGAISQSGCATCFWSISENAAETARKYAEFLNCTGGSSEELVTCLRTKDAATLAATQLALLEWTMYPVVIFGPVLEPPHPGAFLEELPETTYKSGGVAPVPWISGFNHDEGAINIAVLFLNKENVAQLNSEWDKYGPIFLDLKNTEGEENAVGIARKVRQFYFGSEPFTFENREKAIKMFSDRYVIGCGVKGIQLHARYSPQPVYAYRLAFMGKYSIVQLLGQNPQNWGISHMDDLIYLFNNTGYYPTLNVEDEEYKMSKIITSTWANFAKTGKPHLSLSSHENENHENELSPPTPVWNPVRKVGLEVGENEVEPPIDYLDLNLSPSMINDPLFERVEFWRSLGLKDQ